MFVNGAFAWATHVPSTVLVRPGACIRKKPAVDCGLALLSFVVFRPEHKCSKLLLKLPRTLHSFLDQGAVFAQTSVIPFELEIVEPAQTSQQLSKSIDVFDNF